MADIISFVLDKSQFGYVDVHVDGGMIDSIVSFMVSDMLSDISNVFAGDMIIINSGRRYLVFVIVVVVVVPAVGLDSTVFCFFLVVSALTFLLESLFEFFDVLFVVVVVVVMDVVVIFFMLLSDDSAAGVAAAAAEAL